MAVPTNAGIDDDWANKFSGKLFLVLLDRKKDPSTRGGRSLWALSQPLSFASDIGPAVITVPPGVVTDLASIPRWAWVLLPPDGPWVKAAIIHDFLYATGGDGKAWNRDSSIKPLKVFTRAEADRVLLEAMVNRHVGAFQRTIIYLAVRIGGGFGWGRVRHSRKTNKRTKQPPLTEQEVRLFIETP
jgi:hypothetical protein